MKSRRVYLVKTRLSIEQNYVTVDEVSLHDITYPEPICNRVPIAKLEKLLEPATASSDIICARMQLAPIPYSLL